jgi:SAM-dependent methyltransferase
MSDTAGNRKQTAQDYFDMLAEIGITKHLGSMAATRSILDRAQLDAGALLLDIGCGIGLTPAWIARHHGARVIGIDITFGMLQRAKEEARARGVEDRVAYCVADAQALPFAAGTFDTVMAESVYVFVPDRPAAFADAVRVTVPGGHIGITESTWLVEPDAEAEAFMTSIGGDPLAAEDWVALMEGAGLAAVTSETARVDARVEARGRIERFGCRSLIRSTSRALKTLLRSPKSRRVLRRAMGAAPGAVARNMGYGVYTGRKPDDGPFSSPSEGG